MPEAPEVEAVARTLRPLVSGRMIRACRVIHPITVRPVSPASLARSLRNNRIVKVVRHGKYLILLLSRGCVVIHFRLDGRLLWFAGPPLHTLHVDVLLELDRGTLGFVDQRHFGRVNWYPTLDTAPGLTNLGVDVFSPQFTPRVLAAIVSSSSRPLKQILMDQTKLAGLGNIYSNESLWHARLSPCRAANRTSPKQVRVLHKAIVSTARRALECCCHPAPDFRDPEWWFQGLEQMLRVYGREGKPCRRCSGRIKRIQQGGRSTFFCPRCQR